jgi:hypothetical protein
VKLPTYGSARQGEAYSRKVVAGGRIIAPGGQPVPQYPQSSWAIGQTAAPANTGRAYNHGNTLKSPAEDRSAVSSVVLPSSCFADTYEALAAPLFPFSPAFPVVLPVFSAAARAPLLTPWGRDIRVGEYQSAEIILHGRLRVTNHPGRSGHVFLVTESRKTETWIQGLNVDCYQLVR